jgi:hypothetical protein
MYRGSSNNNKRIKIATPSPVLGDAVQPQQPASPSSALADPAEEAQLRDEKDRIAQQLEMCEHKGHEIRLKCDELTQRENKLLRLKRKRERLEHTIDDSNQILSELDRQYKHIWALMVHHKQRRENLCQMHRSMLHEESSVSHECEQIKAHIDVHAALLEEEMGRSMQRLTAFETAVEQKRQKNSRRINLAPLAIPPREDAKAVRRQQQQEEDPEDHEDPPACFRDDLSGCSNLSG